MNHQIATHEGHAAGNDAQIASHRAHLEELRHELVRIHQESLTAIAHHNLAASMSLRHRERHTVGEIQRFQNLVAEATRENAGHAAHAAELRALPERRSRP